MEVVKGCQRGLKVVGGCLGGGWNVLRGVAKELAKCREE